MKPSRMKPSSLWMKPSRWRARATFNDENHHFALPWIGYAFISGNSRIFNHLGLRWGYLKVTESLFSVVQSSKLKKIKKCIFLRWCENVIILRLTWKWSRYELKSELQKCRSVFSMLEAVWSLLKGLEPHSSVIKVTRRPRGHNKLHHEVEKSSKYSSSEISALSLLTRIPKRCEISIFKITLNFHSKL